MIPVTNFVMMKGQQRRPRFHRLTQDMGIRKDDPSSPQSTICSNWESQGMIPVASFMMMKGQQRRPRFQRLTQDMGIQKDDPISP